MPGDGHAGFGERSGETGQEQSGYRAPDRLNRLGSGSAVSGRFLREEILRVNPGVGFPAAHLSGGLSGFLARGWVGRPLRPSGVLTGPGLVRPLRRAGRRPRRAGSAIRARGASLRAGAG